MYKEQEQELPALILSSVLMQCHDYSLSLFQVHSPTHWTSHSCRWLFPRWSRRWGSCWRTAPASACRGWSSCQPRPAPASGSASPCCRTPSTESSPSWITAAHCSVECLFRLCYWWASLVIEKYSVINSRNDLFYYCLYFPLFSLSFILDSIYFLKHKIEKPNKRSFSTHILFGRFDFSGPNFTVE